MSIGTRTTGQALLFPAFFGFNAKNAATSALRRERVEDPFEDAELVTLLAAMVDDIESHRENPAKRGEVTFPEVVSACIKSGCFPWVVTGATVIDRKTGDQRFELSQRGKSELGRILSRNCGRLFEVRAGLRVKLAHRGRNRHRRYRLTIMPEGLG